MAVGLSLAFIVAASTPALADQARRNEWWLRTLHITSAWQTTRGSGVTVAVLDTGVNPRQADLTGSVTTGPDYTNSGRTSGSQFWGVNGTEVASLIAGHGHGPGQANGVIGIAPAAKILSVRVTLESNDPLLSNQTIAAGLPGAIARGIRWAVRHNASVIDLPLDPVTTSGAAGSGGSAAERSAVGFALAKHVVLVAPAGDQGAGNDAVNYPAAYRGVIAVGAFDRQFIKAPFSSHRRYVTVTAAGAGVTAASPAGSYPQLSSTTAASAVVAGIVALIRAQFPTLTPAQVTRALTSSTVFHPPGGRADGSGFGTVDAAKALMAAAGIAETVSKSAASGQAAPSPPAVRGSAIHRNISGTLIKDAAIAGVVFLLLLALIFTVASWRRRHARSARLAEVRAATQPTRKAAPAAAGKRASGKGTKGTAKAKGTARARGAAGAKGGAEKRAPASPRPAAAGPDSAAEPQLEPAGFIAAPPGAAAQGPAGSGFTGSSSGFTGSGGFTGSAGTFTPSPGGFTGFAGTFTGSAAGFTGSSAGFTGSASSGFAAAPTPSLGPDGRSDPGGFSDAGERTDRSGVPGLGAQAGLGAGLGPSAGLGSPLGPAAADASAAGAVPPDLASLAAGTGAPWAPIQSDPRTQARDAGSAAIPDSAFPGFPAAAPADPTAAGSEPAGAGRGPISSRLAQGPRQPRNAPVSGRPPWEPAPEPNSELPWAQAPAPPRGAASPLPKREQVRPDMPSWDELAQDVWPGGPKSATPHPPVPSPAEPNGRRDGGASPTGRVVPAAGLVPPQPDSPEQVGHLEGRSDYRWSPGAGFAPFSAVRSEPAPAPGGTDLPPADAADPADSQPGVPSAWRPSLALPRRLGGAVPRQPGIAADGPGPARGAAMAAGGLAGAAGSAAPGAWVAGAGPTGADWPGSVAGQPLFPPAPEPSFPAANQPPFPAAPDLGVPATSQPPFPAAPDPTFPATSQPPFPPAPDPTFPAANQPPFPPAPDPGLPVAGQAERGPFPRAIKPPSDSGTASTSAWGARTPDAGPPGADQAKAAFPRPGSPSPDPGPAEATAPFAAAKPGAGSTQPKASMPPWEITDSFLAVPPAGAGEATRADPGPMAPGESTDGEPVDGTKSFPGPGSGAERRSFPPVRLDDSTESFPTVRPRADMEDAFRLFPPVRGTDDQPPTDD